MIGGVDFGRRKGLPAAMCAPSLPTSESSWPDRDARRHIDRRRGLATGDETEVGRGLADGCLLPAPDRETRGA
jgi:hypothetical protein